MIWLDELLMLQGRAIGQVEPEYSGGTVGSFKAGGWAFACPLSFLNEQNEPRNNRFMCLYLQCLSKFF